MRKLKIIMAILLIGGPASAQEMLTFEKAIDMALAQNHTVKIARNNAEMAANRNNAGNAGLFPSLSLSGGSTYQESGSAGTMTTSGTVSASYTIFDGFGNYYRFRGLQAGEMLAEEEARQLIETTLLGVSSAYYGAASAYEQLMIAEELLAISQERLKRAMNRNAFGRAGNIDVLAARVDLISDSVTVMQAKLIWEESRRNLNGLLNRAIDHRFTVSTEVGFNRVFDLETVKSAAADRNASLLVSGHRVNQARYDAGEAKAAHFPRLDLSTSYGVSRTESGWTIRTNDMTPALRVGATLSFNIFNGFQASIQRQNAILALENSELNHELERLDLEKEVISAYETYHNARLVMDLEARSVEAAELNFQRTEDLYSLGQVTTTQFREAQLNLIRARSELAAAKYDAKMSEIELLRLSGMLLDTR